MDMDEFRKQDTRAAQQYPCHRIHQFSAIPGSSRAPILFERIELPPFDTHRPIRLFDQNLSIVSVQSRFH
jgi:hypothetical protein